MAFRCTQAISASGLADGPALTWPKRHLTYSLQASGTAHLPTEATFAVLRQAFSVWQELQLADEAQALCPETTGQPGTDLTFAEAAQSQADWVGYDFLHPQTNNNLLVFRDTGWNGDPSNGDVIALTTTTYSALTGAILDADIEFNSYTFAFTTGDPNADQMDLLGTAVHEVGHFLGIAHCTSAAVPCGHDEVMEPVGNYGSTNKRLLKCDDRAAAVYKYPAGAAASTCSAAAAECASGCLPAVLPGRVPAVAEHSSDMGRGCQATSSLPWLAGPGFMAWLWRRARPRGPGAGFSGWPRRQRWRIGAVCIVASLAMGLAGCEEAACGGHAAPFHPAAPRILNMRLVKQVSNDPWRVVLACDFVDPDGDLGAGMASFYINGSKIPRQTFALASTFASSGGLGQDATSGQLSLLVRFAPDTPAGAHLHLCTQLVDAAGHVSNCFGLDLSFNFEAADPATLLRTP